MAGQQVKAPNLHETIILFFRSTGLKNCEDYGCVKVYKSGEVELDGNQSEESLRWRE
jgi:hypothetical protein